MSARGKARARALDILFEADQRGVPASVAIQGRRDRTEQVINPYTVDDLDWITVDKRSGHQNAGLRSM